MEGLIALAVLLVIGTYSTGKLHQNRATGTCNGN